MKAIKDIILGICIVCCILDIKLLLENTYNEWTIVSLICFAIYFPIEITTRLIKNNYDK